MNQALSGRYELRQLLGRGGMGEVHRGWDVVLERPVAVKLLHPALSSQPELRSRLHREARAAAALSHPNIVAIHDFGEEAGAPFIVMEELPGITLADEIARGPMPTARVRHVMGSVLAALEAAHRAGVLHRDIKPGNILLTAAGDVKVGDFGVATTLAATQTTNGEIRGTMAYISPQRLAGQPASTADDLYALGVVGYEALTGRRPFGPEDNIAALARAILTDDIPPIHAFRPDVPAPLDSVITSAIGRDPRGRFGSARDMRVALDQPIPRPPTKVLAAPVFPPSGYGTPIPAAAGPQRGRRQGRTAALAAATVALLAAVVTALAMAADPSPVPTQSVGTATTSTQQPGPLQQPAPPPPAPSIPQSETAAVSSWPVTPEPPRKGKGKGKKED